MSEPVEYRPVQYRVVTAEQLSKGWISFARVLTDEGEPIKYNRHEFEVVRRLDDGNYVVIEPGEIV